MRFVRSLFEMHGVDRGPLLGGGATGNGPAVKHIGAISGGKDSTAMARRLTELHPEIKFERVCTPTRNEPAAWFAHMRGLRDVIGPIIPVMYPRGRRAPSKQWNAVA